MTAIDWPLTRLALTLLRDVGIQVAEGEFIEDTERFRRLCSTWNLATKLMSARDLETKFDSHVADSLALLPYLGDGLGRVRRSFVDIGSGGGFPAIPLKIGGLNVPSLLVERSARKADFLNQAIRQLALPDTRVIRADFPDADLPPAPRSFTARATESPETVDAAILSTMREGDAYLSQRPIPESMVPDGLRSVPIADEFDRRGLRRGRLAVVAEDTDIETFHVEPDGRRRP